MMKRLHKWLTEHLWWPLLLWFDWLAKGFIAMGGMFADWLRRCADYWHMSIVLIEQAFNSDDLIDNVAAFIIVVSTICLVGTCAAGIIVHWVT